MFLLFLFFIFIVPIGPIIPRHGYYWHYMRTAHKAKPSNDLTGRRQGSVTSTHDYKLLHKSRISKRKDFTFANA